MGVWQRGLLCLAIVTKSEDPHLKKIVFIGEYLIKPILKPNGEIVTSLTSK